MTKALHIVLVLSAFSILPISAEQKTKTPEQQKQEIITQLTAGPINRKSETLIKKFFIKYGSDTENLIIAKPSQIVQELNPTAQSVYLYPQYKLFVVNEQYFNPLTPSEKEALIAGWAIWEQEYPNAVRKGWIILIIVLIIEICAAIALYRYLGKKTKFSKLMRTILAIIFLLILDKVYDVWEVRYKYSLRFAQDKLIVEKIGSKEGFLSLLKRRQKQLPELKKSANAEYWKAYETILLPRIKHLEKLEL